MTDQITPASVIEGILALREKRSIRKKEFDAADIADKDAAEALEMYLLGVMNERGEEQIKTSAGTAYKSPQMRVTMTDREAVIKFTLDRIEKNDPNAFDLFTNHVNKESVKILLENRITPPGVDIQTFVQCNVRRA
jgi:hypothetical protein